MNLWIQLLIVAFAFLNYVSADKTLILNQKILDDILVGQHKDIRPYGKTGTGPVVVEVSFYVHSIHGLDDEKMVYSAELTLQLKWLDDRFQFDNSLGVDYVTLTNPDRVWTPDLFFSKEISGHFHNILKPNNFIRIYPDGHILYSTRVSLELFCPMDLRNYPMDRQFCNIKAASYRYTTNDVLFLWKETDPVQVVQSELLLPEFTLGDINTDYCTSETYSGENSCIVVNFEFSRAFTSHFIQTYMPTALLVILSWITFWLHPRSVPIRLSIWIGVLLSMVILTRSVSERGPRVSYIRAIDVWIGTCIVFIFCILIEMVLVHNALTEDNSRRTVEETNNTMGMDDDIKNKGSRPTHYSARPLQWLNKYSTQAQRIDAVSRCLFPAVFALFNFGYWLTYMTK